MGIIFIHTEDSKYHTYKIRSKLIYIGSAVLLLILFYGSIYLLKYTKQDTSRYYTFSSTAIFLNTAAKFGIVLSIIFVIFLLIDIAPMEYRQMKCFWNRKNMIAKGTWLRGDWELKLEK